MLIENQEKEYIILYIDIEHFKLYNDWYGHQQGDRLLKGIAIGLKQVANTNQGICGHFGGDDFALLVLKEQIDIQEFEKEVVSWLNQIDVKEGFLPAIGVYKIDKKEAISISSMCDRAAIAANFAKGNYLTRVAYYEKEMKRKLEIEHETLFDVKQGIENEEFEIYLQPKCNMLNNKIVGYEALVRWNHPTKGLVYPKEFIPVLENNGFILKLDLYVWEKTCQLIQSWIKKGYRPIPISINISRADIFQSDVVKKLQALVKKYEIDIDLLEVEITESELAKDTNNLLVVIKQLRNSGFTVLMDDFGSGYSCLNMLRDIEVDTLKIDMSFLYLDENSGHKGTGIIESIVNLAHWMNLNVIAEGVESEEQVQYLSNIGCRFAQGYYYYKPQPVTYFDTYMQSGEGIDYDGIKIKQFDQIQLKDLLKNDINSETLLRNIFGGIVMYDYFEGEIKLIKMNDYYQRVLDEYGVQTDSIDIRASLQDDYERFKQLFEKAQDIYSQGEEGIFRYALSDSKVVWTQIKIYYFQSQKGHKHFYGTIRDISEMQQLQQQRDAFINSSSDFIEKLVVKHNQFNERIVIHQGMKKGSAFLLLNEDNFCDLIHLDDQQKVIRFYKSAKDWKENEHLEFRICMKNNELIWIEQKLNYAYEENGDKIFYCTSRDITKDMQIKRELIESKEIIAETIGIKSLGVDKKLNNENLKAASKYINNSLKGGTLGGYCEDGYPIYFASQSMIEYLGYHSYEELNGAIEGKIINIIHPDDLARVHDDIGDKYYEGLTYTTKYRMLRKDGSSFWVFNSGRVVYTENGKLASISIVSDISDIIEMENKMNCLTNSLAGDIIKIEISEAHCFVRLLSQGLAKSLNLDQTVYTKILKKEIEKLFSNQRLREILLLLEINDQKRSFEILISQNNGKRIWIDLSISIVKKEAGVVTCLGITTDISKYKESEEDVNLTKRYFYQLTHFSGLELWELNPTTMKLKFFDHDNNYILNSIGYFSDIPDFLNTLKKDRCIHPESLQNLTYFVKHLKEGYENLTCQVHFLTPKKVDIWVEFNAGAYYDELGNLVKILGSTKDITRQKLEEIKNLQINKFLDNIEKQSMFNCRVNLSRNTVLNLQSDVAKTNNNQSYSDYMTLVIEQVSHPDYKEGLSHFLDKDRILNEYRTNYITTSSYEYLRLVKKQFHWVKVIYSIVVMDNNDEVYAYTYVIDINEEKQRELQLLRKAQIDSLTGLLNRSTAKSIINQKLMEKQDKECTGAFLILDLDNFKLVNDSFGHVSGDQILIENALRLKQQFRREDIICRLGGDEFVVMCCHIDEDSILKKVQQICENMRTVHQCENRTFETSVSIGIAMIPKHGQDFDALYKKADNALYKAKQEGKGNYRVYKKQQ